MAVFQVFYATPIKDYWLVISKTYCYEEQQAVIEKIVEVPQIVEVIVERLIEKETIK